MGSNNPLAATIELNLMWLIADIMNGLMSIPNLLALILLAPGSYKKRAEKPIQSLKMNMEKHIKLAVIVTSMILQ